MYLSPELQVALRIDHLCEVYERMILLTGDLYRLLSEQGRTFCRKIDSVTMNETPNTHKVSAKADTRSSASFMTIAIGHLLFKHGSSGGV